jgi:branched-chain amino acid transport system permease protein
MIAPETGVFRTTYLADLTLHQVPFARQAIIAFLLFMLLGVPLIASDYQVYVVDTMLIACIGAVGLNLLTGYAGQISIGQGAFMGVGAFVSAMLSSRLGVPFWLSVPAGGSVAGVVGLAFGLPSVRLKGLYLAISTLAAQVIVEWVLSRPGLVGGGSVSAPRPALLDSDRAYYFLLLAVCVGAVLYAENLLRTRIGRALVAIRDHDIAATVIGIDVPRYKLLAFGVSSFYAGLAGALLGFLGRTVNVEQFQLDLSIQYLAMIVIGGLGSIPGAIFGAVFITLLPIVLRSVMGVFGDVLPGNPAVVLSSAQFFLFGLVIVVFMTVESHGLARIWQNVKDYVRLWPFSY